MRENFHIIRTGGTLAMLSISGKDITSIEPEQKDVVVEDKKYLYPVCDIKFFALAAAIGSLDQQEIAEISGEITSNGTKDHFVKIRSLESILERSPDETRYVELEILRNGFARDLDKIAAKVCKYIGHESRSTNELGREHLDHVIGLLGIRPDDVESVYNIDSVNFDTDEHYQALLERSVACLSGQSGYTLVITGGTDTKEFYSSILSKDLARRGHLNKNKVVFASSMISFEDSPVHVGKLIKAVTLMADQNMTGAFALSAMDKSAETIDVFGLLGSSIFKTSHTIGMAFAGSMKAGVIEGDRFTKHPDLVEHKQTTDTFSGATKFNKICPPFITGNDIEAVTCGLEQVLTGNAFDGVVIEWNPSWISNDTRKKEKFIQTVSALTDHNVSVTIVNDKKYHSIKGSVAPSDEVMWGNSGFHDALQQAGASCVVCPTNFAYTDELLRQKQPRKEYASSEILPPKTKFKALGYLCVPDKGSMLRMVDIGNQIADTQIISAIAGERMSFALFLELQERNIDFRVGYKYYAGEFDNHYADASLPVKRCGKPPSDLLHQMNAKPLFQSRL